MTNPSRISRKADKWHPVGLRLFSVSDKPTHILNHILDWVVVRSDKTLIVYDDVIRYPGLSDHYAVIGYLKIVRPARLSAWLLLATWGPLWHTWQLFIFKEYVVSDTWSEFVIWFVPVKWSITTTGIKINLKIHVAAIITYDK